MALIVEPPLSVKTGGTNRTDYSAGTNSEDNANKNELTITGKDKAGGCIDSNSVGCHFGWTIWMIF